MLLKWVDVSLKISQAVRWSDQLCIVYKFSFIWFWSMLEINIDLPFIGSSCHCGSFVFRFERRPGLFQSITRLFKWACEYSWAQWSLTNGILSSLVCRTNCSDCVRKWKSNNGAYYILTSVLVYKLQSVLKGIYFRDPLNKYSRPVQSLRLDYFFTWHTERHCWKTLLLTRSQETDLHSSKIKWLTA